MIYSYKYTNDHMTAVGLEAPILFGYLFSTCHIMIIIDKSPINITLNVLIISVKRQICVLEPLSKRYFDC